MATAIGVKATVIAPFHYHSLAVQSGTATLARFIPDRTVAFALQNALGGLAPSPALPQKDYGRDLRRLGWMASVFESGNARLMKPLGKRLNIDCEGGCQQSVVRATASGNLKTWFSVQEVAVGSTYVGAVFGRDPFDAVSEIAGRRVDEIVVRTGRHLGGALRLERHEVDAVRLNLHTPVHLGRAPSEDAKMEIYALHDLQVSVQVPVGRAAEIVAGWLG